MKTRNRLEETARTLIELRLSRWARYERRESDQGLGYPKKSNFARRAPCTEHIWTAADEAECWETGNAIQHLDHLHQMVIRAKWIAPGLMTAKYAALKMSQQRFGVLYSEALNELARRIKN